MLNVDPSQLAALSEVLRTGSFDRAAAVLSVTPSAISQRIKALEERLGTVLIRRGQPCTGTAAGQRLLRHAEEVALLEHALAADLGPVPGATGVHTVRIAANADSLATWLPEALAAASLAAPGLLFDVTLDDQDHSAEWLRRGEVAAAVTSHADPIQGCDSLTLGALRYHASASPGFMVRHFPDGISAEACAKAPMLTFNRKDELQSRWLSARFKPPPAPPTHFLPASQAFVDAAKLGLGWGMNPEQLLRVPLANGELALLDVAQPLDTPLYWQSIRAARPALAPLTRAIREVAQQQLRVG
ncbi:LysR family transcriptional regulator ArgP [Tropicimonas sp. TH_r6]|uniref:LysR family transcriptional regulator ArgP n=1 Tax=Tropicimonas sp. TH_r6 TaxID=3082085 RepID=UPI00295463EA|nr:LysR family transcriptional regulator ArgP [Tropicimonas sp. TH_r6]MDV7143326.1 LysR family transcriptional regulator ArgP [Tropicimonas sp. TH_r6]